MELNSVNHRHKTINGIDTLRLVLLYGYVMRSQKNVRVVSVFGKNQFTFGSKSAFCSNKSILKIDFSKAILKFLCLRDDLNSFFEKDKKKNQTLNNSFFLCVCVGPPLLFSLSLLSFLELKEIPRGARAGNCGTVFW